MQQCPHCGSRVDGEPSCPNCGQSFEALSEPSRDDTTDEAEPPTQTEQATDPAGEAVPGPQSDDEATDSRRLSRRALLGGAGVSVALLGAGGAGWVFLRGGGEGRRVIRSYVDAMAANEFGRVPELFHDDAPVLGRLEQRNEFDDYEGYLEQRGALEGWRNVEPELNGTEELYHITDVSAESVEQLNIQMGDSTASDIGEFRQVAAFLTVSVGAVNPERESTAEYYDNETEQLPLTCAVVRSSEGWQLWTARARLAV